MRTGSKVILDKRTVVEYVNGEDLDTKVFVKVPDRISLIMVERTRLSECYSVKIIGDGEAKQINMSTNANMGKRHVNYEWMLIKLPYVFGIQLGKYKIEPGEKYYAYIDNGTGCDRFVLIQLM